MRHLMNSHRTAPVLGGLTILLVCAGAGCLGGYAAIGSRLEPDGTLTEPFFLVPLFWLCMLGALCAFLLFTAAALARRGERRLAMRWGRLNCLLSALGWAALTAADSLLGESGGCAFLPLSVLCMAGAVLFGLVWLICAVVEK